MSSSHTHAHHSHSHGDETPASYRILRVILSALLFIAAFAGMVPEKAIFWCYLAAYLTVGCDVIYSALKRLAAGQWFDENFLMSVASIGAFALGEYPEGVAVMLFYQVGEYFQDKAVDKSRRSIAEMMNIRPDVARLKRGDAELEVSPEEVRVGDQVIVKAGERIPLDGVVFSGRAALDTSALTGESVPRMVEPGDRVMSGTVNKDGLLHIEVTREYGDSTIVRILEMVQNASERKAPTENFITKFSFYYTPAVILLALLVAVLPPLFGGGEWSLWIHRALVLLVISCPCALVLSVPLSFFAGIGAASRQGILVKGGNYLEALTRIDTLVFDKTGTLTEGVFKVVEITPANGWTEKELLELTACAESGSNHAIASSIRKSIEMDITPDRIQDYREIAGQGVTARVDGRLVLAGNARLMEEHYIDYAACEAQGTRVYVAVDGVFAGVLLIADQIKDDSLEAIRQLRQLGIGRVVMLTGDLEHVGRAVRESLEIDEVRAELLPDQKVEELEQLFQTRQTDGSIVFVGDGLNDAPVLARADIGVAMGGLGADASIEAADIVLMTDEPSRLATAVRIARHTRKLATQNIVFALCVKVIVLTLGIMGIATMWEAVFADVGVALLAVLNAIRGFDK